jgi:hypothetical protein
MRRGRANELVVFASIYCIATAVNSARCRT